MLTTLITIFTLLALGGALRSRSAERLIASRPYENRYSDASAARQSWLG